MELFNKEGHLTDEGLRAVVDGTLDEMGRLEASEHLSFCDRLPCALHGSCLRTTRCSFPKRP